MFNDDIYITFLLVIFLHFYFIVFDQMEEKNSAKKITVKCRLQMWEWGSEGGECQVLLFLDRSDRGLFDI
jgi:hypothetical protein